MPASLLTLNFTKINCSLRKRQVLLKFFDHQIKTIIKKLLKIQSNKKQLLKSCRKFNFTYILLCICHAKYFYNSFLSLSTIYSNFLGGEGIFFITRTQITFSFLSFPKHLFPTHWTLGAQTKRPETRRPETKHPGTKHSER
jgi:hypothetical protein